MADCCQVTTTLPDQATAERMAACLVEERLAAVPILQENPDYVSWIEESVK